MKQLTIKNMVLIALQLPLLVLRLILVFTELVLAYIDFLITKCLVSLTNPLFAPLTENTSIEATSDIDIVFSLLNKSSRLTVHRVRVALERTDPGRRAITMNPDRHLYAVKRPTKTEDLRRIANVLMEMEPASRNRVLRNAKRILPLYDTKARNRG